MGKDFTTSLRPAIVLTILFAILLGILYPVVMTGIGQALFPSQANGSLVRDSGGRVIGSTVIGQAFTSDRYFQTRPSAAGKGYDGLASSGSNLGPAAQALADRVRQDVAKRRSEGITGAIPADLVTASGSGLDPDLSPAASAIFRKAESVRSSNRIAGILYWASSAKTASTCWRSIRRWTTSAERVDGSRPSVTRNPPAHRGAGG
jgi:potassium-transporting ATPase KdpC subunit